MVEMVDMENSMLSTIEGICSFEVIIEGKGEEYNVSSALFHKIKAGLKKVYEKGYLMPAFGVSLHAETTAAIKNGLWLKINYIEEQTKNEYPFTALLINIEDNPVYGFNIIREHNGKYEGRCLYLNLENETKLLDIIR